MSETTPVLHQLMAKYSHLDTFLVCPTYGLHVSRTCPVGILRHCPIHFHYCPFPTVHYHTITGQKLFCACALGASSTHPLRPIGSCLTTGYPHLGPLLFYFICFCFAFYQFSFHSYIIYKFLTTPIFWIGVLRGPASV